MRMKWMVLGIAVVALVAMVVPVQSVLSSDRGGDRQLLVDASGTLGVPAAAEADKYPWVSTNPAISSVESERHRAVFILNTKDTTVRVMARLEGIDPGGGRTRSPSPPPKPALR